jgi:hypothetical protein
LFSADPDSLKHETYYGISGELTYKNDNKEFRIASGYVKIKNIVWPTPQGYANYNEPIDAKLFMIDYKQDLTTHITTEVNFYANYIGDFDDSSRYGGFLRILGDYRKFNFFTELIYRSPFTFKDIYNNLQKRVDDSWDLNIGCSFSLTPKLELKIKGENILNDSPKVPYISSEGIKTYSSWDRKFFITLEMSF